MRPQSIANFERFYLGSLVLSLLATVLTWNESVAAIEADSPPEFQFGAGFLIISMVVGVVVTLLLWYLVAHKRSVVAKWIVVLFFLLGLVSFALSLASGAVADELGAPFAFAVSILGTIAQAIAVWMLFRPDAKAWLEGSMEPSPDTFS